MLQYPCYVKESSIPGAGKGLFASGFIPKKSMVVFHYTRPHHFVHESVFQELCGKGDKRALEYGLRFFDDIFSYPEEYTDWEEADQQDFINHSQDPNLLTAFNVSYALRDIQPDEELFVNYSYYFPYADSHGVHRPFLHDLKNEVSVFGFSNETAKAGVLRNLSLLLD